MESPVIFCVQCGTQLRGPFCWKCGAASVITEADLATTGPDALSRQPEGRHALQSIALRNAAHVAIAAVAGTAALVFPAIALLLALSYVASLTWFVTKHERPPSRRTAART